MHVLRITDAGMDGGRKAEGTLSESVSRTFLAGRVEAGQVGGHVNDSSLPQSPGGRIDPGQCSYYLVPGVRKSSGWFHLVYEGGGQGEEWGRQVARNEHIGASVGFTTWRRIL